MPNMHLLSFRCSVITILFFSGAGQTKPVGEREARKDKKNVEKEVCSHQP
jgi:hypothetical protein